MSVTALPVRHVEHCMGTVFSFDVRGPGVSRGELRAVLDWLHAMDAMFSTYRDDSEISALNAGRLRLREASAEVREVLAACAEMSDATDGFFSDRPDGSALDPSGYVKGWAAQTASDMLEAAGSVNHSLNAGGDVICVGRPEPQRPWRVGISDPHDRQALLRTVVGDGPLAVATSGLAERGAHVHDPHTGRVAIELASVSVIARDLITADVYATAAMAMGAERGATWLSGQPGISAVLVRADRHVVEIAPGLPR